jgi:outer membrane lipoprotein-sorting protein
VKNFVLLLLSLFSLNLLHAQAPKPNEAEKLMEKISKKYKGYKSIKADFVYSLENRQQKSQDKQNGSILVKGNKFRLNIANQVIICDNKTIWTYSKEVNEVQINNYSPKEGAIRMDDIFTMYGKGFLYKMLETRKEGNKVICVIELTPKDKKKKFFKIKVTVEKNTQTIMSSQIFEKNGNIHTYLVSTQVPNAKVDEKQFSFEVKNYPGVEVIDLR